jgi:uncharacterized repeat protein (TIGR01451 family)
VPAGTYTATASALAHVDATAVVQVEAAQTTVQDLDLRLFEPCLALAPTTFSVTLSVDTVWTETLSISNGGARDLIWAIRETTDTLFLPPFAPIPRFEGELPTDSAPTSLEPAPWSPGQPLSPEAPALLPEPYGAPAYGLDTSTFDLVHIPDITDPGTWDEVANLAVFYSGGDFWHGDFSKMYALDFYTSEFVTIDTSTGERTVVGMAYTLPGHHWTGLTAATDGTLYGVSAATECEVASALYTIDRLTGEATLVGTTTAAPCLIDLAINADGEIYAVDILWDGLYRLDPDTGVATFIGLLGFDANHAQSMDFEEDSGILYWAATDNYNGSLRRIDTDTGNSLHLGYFPNYTAVDCLAFATGGGDPFWGDVPWVREVPTAGLTLAGDAMEVDVVFDTTVLTTEQCYEAGLGLLHDDPYYEQPAMVPLTLCVRLPWPVFYLTKSSDVEEVLAGDPLSYTLVFGNDGFLETGITISDVLPVEVEYGWSDPPGVYDPVAHEVVWSGLELDEGERMTATIGVGVGTGLEPGTLFANTAYLLWRDDVLSDSASVRVVESPWPDFYLTKTAAVEEVLAGDPLTYTLVFGNDGDLETGIVISDVLPAGVEYAWSTPAGAYDPQAHVLSWGGLVLDEGARMTATAVVTVGVGMEPGTWLTNTAYLLWRDDVLSNWVSLQVGGEAQQYVYLPVVVKGHAGE